MRRAALQRLAVTTTILVVMPGAGANTLAHDGEPEDRAIFWDAGAVRIQAEHLEIVTTGRVFGGAAATAEVRSMSTSPAARRLDAKWVERHPDRGDVALETSFELASDGSTWWIDALQVRITDTDGVAARFNPSGPGATVGDTLSVSIDVEDSAESVAVHIHGLTIDAFRRGSLIQTMEDCVPAIVLGSIGTTNPADPGQPLAGVDLGATEPRVIHERLVTMEYCHTFRLLYRLTESQTAGYSEVWCDPPDGRVVRAEYLDDGSIVILVVGEPAPSIRPQPVGGWGCLSTGMLPPSPAGAPA